MSNTSTVKEVALSDLSSVITQIISLNVVKIKTI